MTVALQLLQAGALALVLQGSAITPVPCTGNCQTLQLDSGVVKGKVCLTVSRRTPTVGPALCKGVVPPVVVRVWL